jgi:hypothetical protein
MTVIRDHETSQDRFVGPDLYKTHLELMRQIFNWPQWPPEAIPPDIQWWKGVKPVFPNSAIRLKYSIPSIIFIELDGASQSGKTTIREGLSQSLGPDLKSRGWDLEVLEETIGSVPEKELFLIRPAEGLPPDDLDDDSLLLLEKDWSSTIWLQVWKETWLRNQIIDRVSDIGKSPPKVVVIYRGAFDVLNWYYAIFGHKIDPNFVIPTEFRDTLSETLISGVAGTHALLRHFDAGIFLGLDQTEAQRRRSRAGKTYPGWVADSPMFKDLSAWTGRTITDSLPNYYQHYGIGSLVVDAASPLEENVSVVSHYILDIARKRSKNL